MCIAVCQKFLAHMSIVAVPCTVFTAPATLDMRKKIHRWKKKVRTPYFPQSSPLVNSTELNWTGSFSWVQFSFPLWIEPATTGDGRHRFLTVKAVDKPATAVASRSSSSPIFVQRQTLRWLADSQMSRDCEEPATTADFVTESLQIVAGSIHSGKLNWTESFSWVEFSSVSRCALGFRGLAFWLPLGPPLHRSDCQVDLVSFFFIKSFCCDWSDWRVTWLVTRRSEVIFPCIYFSNVARFY